jgi:hypothetical protein
MYPLLLMCVPSCSLLMEVAGMCLNNLDRYSTETNLLFSGRFHCPFCTATTEVLNEYFQHLDYTGQRMEYQRPELCLGTYEMVATKDYCRNNAYPKPPAFIFVIDVSYNNVCPVKRAPRNPVVKVGFITSSAAKCIFTTSNRRWPNRK